MFITSTVEICIQHLGRVEEMVFAARRSYASAILVVVILSVCPTVCHTCALWLIQRTYRRYFYTTWKCNPSSQMWFFIQLCSSWQDFNWLKKGSRGLSVAAELVVDTGTDTLTDLVNEWYEGNMLQGALLPSYVLCGAHSQSFWLVNQ